MDAVRQHGHEKVLCKSARNNGKNLWCLDKQRQHKHDPKKKIYSGKISLSWDLALFLAAIDVLLVWVYIQDTIKFKSVILESFCV